VTVRLAYETHATTTDNEAGVAIGWLPGQLSHAGRVNAEVPYPGGDDLPATWAP